ncbi:hypothetical protein [uncultured Algimonas sp.]|uniref:hypothetical protein n=1 Tax=uncultured Algimonas sp. TaxID=1547920 RepID=UPI0026189181|nr:hypothetical protein [uncultured Algimonas sp.]
MADVKTVELDATGLVPLFTDLMQSVTDGSLSGLVIDTAHHRDFGTLDLQALIQIERLARSNDIGVAVDGLSPAQQAILGERFTKSSLSDAEVS